MLNTGVDVMTTTVTGKGTSVGCCGHTVLCKTQEDGQYD